MAAITFKAKVQEMGDWTGGIAYRYVSVPKLERKHCDMPAFRQHPKFGGFANSDMFPGMLARIASGLKAGSLGLRLDRLPPNVTVDTSGFLAVVTVEV